MSENQITFFMIVTNRDACIADYTIKSYKKLAKRGLNFTLLIYANCLKNSIKNKYFPKWQRYYFVKLFDNKDVVKDKIIKAGKEFLTPHGLKLKYDDNCEHYDDLWSRELSKITTTYHATVDADFEIIKPDFVFVMLKKLEQDPLMIAMSSDYSPTVENHYDTYYKKFMRLNQRWHTWFCIYKKEALNCKEPPHYYETLLPDGKPHVFDSAALFQDRLISIFGYKLSAIDRTYQNQFIHYGAFSKNRTLNSRNIKLYRILALIKKMECSIHRIET